MNEVALPRLRANLVWLDETDSTNLLAVRLLERWQDTNETPFPDAVLVALSQRAGRGRGGHSWESPRGGLYLTWITWLVVERLPWVPLAVSVAVAEALEELAPEMGIGLKWPNDVMVSGCKLAGILCQSRMVGGRAWVAAGVGVNVETTPVLPEPSPAEPPPPQPISLREAGVEVTVHEAAAVVLPAFLRRATQALEFPEAARSRWAERSVHRDGDTLRVGLADGEVVGLFRGFGAHGQLLLEVDGVRRAIAAAEFIAPFGPPGG